jgi:hypothetical protein
MPELEIHKLEVLPISDPSFDKVGRYIKPPPATPGKSEFYPAYTGFNIGAGSDVDISWLYVAAAPWQPKVGWDRHITTEELFIATEGDYYFPAAPCRNPDDPDDIPQPEDFVCWRVNQGDMYVLKPNMWHDGCWAVDPNQMIKFIMVLSGHRASEGGGHVDYYRKQFPEGLAVFIDDPQG